MPISATIAERASRTTGGYKSGVQWPPRAGYYTPAKMPLNVIFPRPDGETQSHARQKWAHSAFEYQVPIGVQGGAWPFKYEITSGPAWLDIGTYHGDTNYGVLYGTPNATGSYPVTVRVWDANDTDYVDVQFTVQSDISNPAIVDSQFVFIEDGYAGAQVGTIDQPLEDFVDWYKNSDSDATYANRIVVYRGGQYSVTGNAASNPTNVRMQNNAKSPCWIGFPEEVAELDCTNAKILDDGLGTNDIYIGGLTFKNGRATVADSHFFFITSNTNRATFHGNTFKDIGYGTVGNDNPCPIFSNDNHPAADKNYFYASDNLFENVNNAAGNGSYIDVYKTSNVCVERNLARNCNTNFGFWMKGTISFVSVRGNVAIESVQGAGCTLGYGLEAHSIPHDHEICWNNFNTSGTVVSFASSNSYAGQHYNTYIYRNALQGNQGVCQYVGAANFVVESNMLNFASYANWNESLMTSTIANIKSSTAINAQGNLTGATGFGTHGWGVQV